MFAKTTEEEFLIGASLIVESTAFIAICAGDDLRSKFLFNISTGIFVFIVTILDIFVWYHFRKVAALRKMGHTLLTLGLIGVFLMFLPSIIRIN